MTPTFQSVTIARIMSAAPTLRYIAFYHADEDRLNACMNGYARRSFVYILSADHGGTEYFLYVGKSKAQYARVLQHMKNYAFDHIYLFECAPEELAENERAVIGELKPLFNRNANPLFRQYKTLLGIDYNARQDAEAIHKYLSAYERYNTKGLFGFTLPDRCLPFCPGRPLPPAAPAANCCSNFWNSPMLRSLRLCSIRKRKMLPPI